MKSVEREAVVCTHEEGILYGYRLSHTLSILEPFISAGGFYVTERQLLAQGWSIEAVVQS